MAVGPGLDGHSSAATRPTPPSAATAARSAARTRRVPSRYPTKIAGVSLIAAARPMAATMRNAGYSNAESTFDLSACKERMYCA